jgi:hypothetical protein
MKITFLTKISADKYESYERHSILINDKEIHSQAEGRCPEDYLFGRDLNSPLDLESTFLDIIKAARENEEIIVEHIQKEWD